MCGCIWAGDTIGKDHVQDRLKPPLRPPRPNRTLGGTNLSADIVEARSSISTSGDDLSSTAGVLVVWFACEASASFDAFSVGF